MCKSHNPRKNDKCLEHIIWFLNQNLARGGFKTLGSCCGHFKYPPTIVMENGAGDHFELFTMLPIFRKKKFYKKDKEGFFYIPEVISNVF